MTARKRLVFLRHVNVHKPHCGAWNMAKASIIAIYSFKATGLSNSPTLGAYIPPQMTSRHAIPSFLLLSHANITLSSSPGAFVLKGMHKNQCSKGVQQAVPTSRGWINSGRRRLHLQNYNLCLAIKNQNMLLWQRQRSPNVLIPWLLATYIREADYMVNWEAKTE